MKGRRCSRIQKKRKGKFLFKKGMKDNDLTHEYVWNDSTHTNELGSRALAFLYAWKYGEHHYTEKHSRPPGDADSALLLEASSAPLTGD